MESLHWQLGASKGPGSRGWDHLLDLPHPPTAQASHAAGAERLLSHLGSEQTGISALNKEKDKTQA